MDGQVQGDNDPGYRRATKKLGVAENSRSAVVIAVEEGYGMTQLAKVAKTRLRGHVGCRRTQRLLLEEEEDGVKELEIFGQVVEIVEHNKGLRPTTIVIADGIKDALAHNSRQNLLDEKSQKDGGDGGQDEVVDKEQGLQLESLPLAHPLAATKNDNVVADDEDTRLLERGHGRDAGLKLELASRIADDGLPGLVEDGP